MSPLLTAIFEDGDFSVCHVDGNRQELLDLASAVTDRTSITCRGENDRGCLPLNRLTSHLVPSSTVLTVTVNANVGEAVFAGNEAALDLLAENVSELAEHGKHGHHCHIEWFEGNTYIAEDSLPLIVGLRV